MRTTAGVRIVVQANKVAPCLTTAHILGEDHWFWLLALGLGSLAAYVDLLSTSRRPLWLLLLLFAGVLAFQRPRDCWR